ncbi:hypothetical protein G8759_25030 [Spirosoma aureum]|uniref:Uncharacterized protein n=1 Tax=Spirosoma aureum TaxID=2692134 RepID=A0A6G9AT49_9BACT|nr:hypothetical protein [Spirosoma aureum]QIP15662.1 hypothetical protein G8759_25030 [Spirosoma aureum]
MHYTEFIIVWTLSVIISLAFMLYPFFQNRALKKATNRFSKQLQQNTALGEEFALSLYRPVDRMNFKAGLEISELMTHLSSLPGQVGGFLIYYKQWVDSNNYLVVTTVDYFRPYETGHEFVTRTGRGDRITYNLNFVIQLDTAQKQVIVLSDLYDTLIDKNLRADFAQAVFTLLRG